MSRSVFISGSRSKQPRHANGFLLEEESRNLNGIASNVHQRSPAPLRDVADVFRITIEVAERAADGAQVANCAGADDFPSTKPLGMTPNHKGFADLHARAVSNGHKFAAFAGA